MYRTGKSYLINRMLLNRQKGFTVGPTVNPCTKGLWIWSKPIYGEGSKGKRLPVLLIDTEGFGALDTDSNHDVRIFTLAILLSSYFLYNSIGGIDESALQNLNFVINLSKFIRLKAGDTETDPEELSNLFPSFLWVCRDFSLQLIDDNGVNHYVANNYSSSVMNFLHCFYGVGAVISPNIMAIALSCAHWNEGYRWTAYIQIGILAVCALSLPLWKKNDAKSSDKPTESAGIRETIKRPGVALTLVAFFAYCSGEATCFLWTSSYFAGTKEWLGDELIAAFGSLIFGGLMLGRLISGFVSNKLGDRLLIRIGIAVELVGIVLIMLPLPHWLPAAIGFAVTGTGMGPVYPAIQHMAPANFGKKYSAAVIGLQMASAYVGSTFMPMAFGFLQQYIGIAVMPFWLLLFAGLNIIMLERTYSVIRARKKGENNGTSLT